MVKESIKTKEFVLRLHNELKGLDSQVTFKVWNWRRSATLTQGHTCPDVSSSSTTVNRSWKWSWWERMSRKTPNPSCT